MADEKPRIAILTSGGDCPGLNAVIRGVVKAGFYLGYEVIGVRRGFEGLVSPLDVYELTPANTTGILTLGGTILGSTNKGRFAARVGVDGLRRINTDLIEQVRGTFQQLRLEGLICVGGDGSLSVAQQFHEAGLPVVGVPKTIDNDLSSTAYTFGFDSAVACATDALDRMHTTAASHGRVMVLEVMGRHTGWIAVHAGIGGGADCILIPEVPWSFENVVAKVQDRAAMGKDFTLVVVAEGATMPGGGQITAEAVRHDAQTRLGGIGQIVTERLQRLLHCDCRCVVLGHLQRGGAPTTFDRVLATQFGTHAVRLIVERRFGQMVSCTPPAIESVPIREAVLTLKTVPPDCSVVTSARALGISFGDAPHYVNPFQGTAPVER